MLTSRSQAFCWKQWLQDRRGVARILAAQLTCRKLCQWSLTIPFSPMHYYADRMVHKGKEISPLATPVALMLLEGHPWASALLLTVGAMLGELLLQDAMRNGAAQVACSDCTLR